VYQISKLEIDKNKDIQDLLTRGSSYKKCFIAANFDTLPRIEDFFFSHGIFGVGISLCCLHM
jgi:hypothetical protein